MQYSLASPIEFLAKFLDLKINESVGVTEETVHDVQRRCLFMEFISSETEYLEMMRLFERTYLARLNKTDLIAWQMTYQVVQKLVLGHEKLLREVFQWLGLPISAEESNAEINWEAHISQIGSKFLSLSSLSSFMEVYVTQLLLLEPHYKEYVHHYSLCNTFKRQGIFNSKLIKQLWQMEPMLKKFQQQRLNSQSTDLFRRNISFESLRHLPVARLGHYKVFFDCFLKTTESLILQTHGDVDERLTNAAQQVTQTVGNAQLSAVAQVSAITRTLGSGILDEFSAVDNWERFKECVGLVQRMLLRVDGVNYSNLVDKPSQRIASKLMYSHPEEYVPISALGIPQLTGILNTVWIEISEGQKLWNNTVRSIDTWRRKKTSYPIFSPRGKQLGAFLYKSYLILARIPMVTMANLQKGVPDNDWTIKFAIPLSNCKLIPIDKEENRYNEMGLLDTVEPNVKLFKLEWFLYGDIFETMFVFDNSYEYGQWSQHLQTMIDLNGFTSKPMEAESVENYYQMGNSAYAPLRIAPKLTFADAVSKTINLNLTKRQYSLINHPVQDYYYYTSFKLNLRFDALKSGPTNERNAIVFSRDKYSYLERQVFALQHPFDSIQKKEHGDSTTSLSAHTSSMAATNTSLIATAETTPSYPASARTHVSFRSKCSSIKAFFRQESTVV